MTSRTLENLYGRLVLGFPVPPHDGMQNLRRMKFLHDSILKFAVRSSGVALEVGCYKGGSTVFLAKACLRKGISDIYAMDLFSGTPSWHQTFDTYEATRTRMTTYQLDRHVTLIRSNSLEYAWDRKIDVFHLDADHEYEAVANDIDKYIPFLTDEGIAVFDDYDAAHPGVKKAVHELLLKHPQFEVVALNFEGWEYGSICLQNRAAGWPR